MPASPFRHADPEPPRMRLGRFAHRALMVCFFNTVIGMGVGIAQGGDWLVQMVYTQSIGFSIWLLIECGRPFTQRDGASGRVRGWSLVLLMAVCVPVGYAIGTSIGDRYCGCSTFSAWVESPRAFVAYLVLTVALSTGIAYYFFARARDQVRLRALALAQRDMAEAQLQVLASQLEPHMLFNTLANLRVLIALDPPRAQAMLDQLIAFLRSTLAASRAGGSHPLADEFARLHDYLGLMQVRMGDRLRFRLDLPPELARCQVSPLLLQPLVENAIKHGLEPHIEGGRLEVSAAREGGQLVLRVRDTGAGLAAVSAPGGASVGLQLVRDRLRARCGELASLQLEDATDAEGGALATIRLPMETAA